MPARKNVLITGASSGIGLAAAHLFSQKGWNVAATVWDKLSAKRIGQLEDTKVHFLDVTNQVSIKKVFWDALRGFGGSDVMINNAVYEKV